MLHFFPLKQRSQEMSLEENKVQEFVSSAVAGSLIGQIAAHRGLSLEDINYSDKLTDMAYEIRDFGLNPHLLTEHALSALVVMFMEEANAEHLVSSITDLLWSLLGDPKSGGTKPPELYRKAGLAMHLFFLGLLDPHVVERKSTHG